MTARQNYKKYGNRNNAKRKLNKISVALNPFSSFCVLYLKTRFQRTRNELTHGMNLKKSTNEDSLAQAEAIIASELQSLYRYACYRLGEREAAQDVIQELYLKLHSQKLGEVKDMRCYLYRALSNSCTQLLRNRRRIEYVDVTSLRDLQAEDIAPTNYEQEQALIARLLAAIPDEQSEVIRLHLHGECTFAEIAEILDIPQPTAKSRYRYGIEHLRQELQKQNLF